ncbi:prepilin-type N-terminal cleavage/methylation domain-containing protein [Helicobacter turcicus]|uniref:Prepilin-type N-terminal cleavage/methylation domain-containing protein n=1 Tax=Helicobacter turcicus TaxID=2867412 RepID=A0ABS7JMM8_9HELI|nr:prepilin-type N-terminal cleavage/methylation domain-containing protein [Helicobacter turcicus]MBX7490635.1 prepilin-type N-terminal cleavage/methylation domain-containing protein [Helicobacter turcicus]MBX7545457.1 prepilin-type N-terminal cleavage/methylation domain-containing protein [Helicobacter turcicus]
MHQAFTLLEVILTLLLIGILLSFGIPQFSNYTKSACVKKLQLQTLNLRLDLKAQLNAKQKINWDSLYDHLDFTSKDCHFSKQKDGFMINYYGAKAYFKLKNSTLECQYSKTARLHNGESMCDIF